MGRAHSALSNALRVLVTKPCSTMNSCIKHSARCIAQQYHIPTCSGPEHAVFTALVSSQVGTFTRYSSQMRGILCIDTRALSYVLFRAETTGSFTESPLTAFWRSRRYACHSCRQHHTWSATDHRSVAAHKRCSFVTLDTDYLCTDITAGQLRPLSPCEGSLHDALMFEHLKQDTL